MMRSWLTRSLCLAITVASEFAVGGDVVTRPVPKAACGPQDRTESVQGQTTLAERFAPGPPHAFNCNLELVGQFEGEGAGADVEAFGDCAYFSTASSTPSPQMQHPGVVVLDASNPRRPHALTYLTSPAMLVAHESLEVAAARGLLLASNKPSMFDVYDVSDCRRPVLKGSSNLPGVLYAHGGQFTADGLTFYGATFDPRPQAAVFALDTRDASHLRTLAKWTPTDEGWVTHGAAVNRQATRAYVAVKRMADDWEKSPNPNGLAIFDISDIQARRRDAQFRLVSTYFWDDTHGAEGMVFAKIRGQPYLIFSDNLGVRGFKRPLPDDVCKRDKPVHGFARIIDLSDESRPTTVSRLMLEVSDPANCNASIHDPTQYGAYGSFACSVDDPDEGRLAACGNFESGVRVFDIRDPAHPAEVAYYKPPGRGTQSRPGSLFRHKPGKEFDKTTDSVVAAPKFRDGATEIWFTSVDNGFQVLRFTKQFKASHPDLFRQ